MPSLSQTGPDHSLPAPLTLASPVFALASQAFDTMIRYTCCVPPARPTIDEQPAPLTNSILSAFLPFSSNRTHVSASQIPIARRIIALDNQLGNAAWQNRWLLKYLLPNPQTFGFGVEFDGVFGRSS